MNKQLAIANPVVGVVRDGILVTCDAAMLSQTTVEIGFDFQMLELQLPIPTFTTTVGVGQKVTIQLPQVSMARLASRVELGRDDTALFAMRTLDQKYAVVQLRVAAQLPGSARRSK